MKKLYSILYSAVAWLAIGFLIFGTVAMHIYTVWLGYETAGFWPATIIFFFVGVSEFIWTFIWWKATGVFFNIYNIIFLSYLFLSFISAIIVIPYFEKKNK
jgi:hypothetical protein